MNKNFSESDADGDSLLNCDEFVAFEKKRNEYQKTKYGEALSFTDDEYREHYKYFDALSPETQGVSVQDLFIANDVYVEIAT